MARASWHNQQPSEVSYRYEVVDEWRERRRVAFFWSTIFVMGLAAAASAFLATSEVLATIQAPRCVNDPAAQAWDEPPL